jgi:hypothetical protein
MLMKVNILSLKVRKTEMPARLLAGPKEAGRGLAFLSDFRTYLTFELL